MGLTPPAFPPGLVRTFSCGKYFRMILMESSAKSMMAWWYQVMKSSQRRLSAAVLNASGVGLNLSAISLGGRTSSNDLKSVAQALFNAAIVKYFFNIAARK